MINPGILYKIPGFIYIKDLLEAEDQFAFAP
jgi:hypothetical protein